MTTTLVSTSSPVSARRPSVIKRGVAAAVIAAGATTGLAAVASAAGVSFADRSGSSIPLAGFAELTLIFALIGVGLAAVITRVAHRPRITFVRVTLTLLALSFIPDLTSGFDAGSAATLIAVHTIAAAIMIPTLATRLPRVR